MIKVVLSILNTGQVPKDLNHTFIELISKKKYPLHVMDYRPISLCKVLYKLISEVIVNHLKTFISHLISECQSTFVPGRQITNNILIAYELIHFLKKKDQGKKGFMSIKLDMSKTYNHVEWNYLEHTLGVMGFPMQFISLIMQCVSTASF